MAEDKYLDCNVHSFTDSVYEIQTEYDNTSVLDFLKYYPTNYFQNSSTYFEQRDILNEEKIVTFKNHIYENLKLFVDQTLNKNFFEIKISWFQKYQEQDFHEIHTHGFEKNAYSLIFYVDASKDSAETTFFRAGYPYIMGFGTINIKPQAGKLVIFPQHLPHCAQPNKDKTRLIFSANFIVGS